MWYQVHLAARTVTHHRGYCADRPRVPTYPCGCTDVARGVPHRTWCAEHVTPAAITRLLGTDAWEEVRCVSCQPSGCALRG